MVTLQTERARWQMDSEGSWLCIQASPNEAKRICAQLSQGKKYDVKITEHREKRSLDANAYCWVLIGKLSEKLGIPPTEIYREYIPNIGGNYHIVPIKEELVGEWDKLWCAGHDGRMTVDMGPCRNAAGYHNVRTYIGSSDYNTRQMSRLIDMIVQDCKEQGIETATPEEIARMESDWRVK